MQGAKKTTVFRSVQKTKIPAKSRKKLNFLLTVHLHVINWWSELLRLKHVIDSEHPNFNCCIFSFLTRTVL
jgi:hypothetical protein